MECPGIDFAVSCPRELIFKLDPKNEGFWFLFQRIWPGLQGGMGGLNYQAIDYVLNAYEIDPGFRPVILDRCLAVISIHREIKDSERRNV